jgi:hypothetical protein
MEEELWRGKNLQLTSSYSDALRRVHLDIGAAHGDLAGDNVIEIDRNYWRNIVVGIWIVRIAPAAGSPGQDKHEAKDNAPQRSMREQKHSLLNLQQSWERPAPKCLIQRNTHILAEPWRDFSETTYF